MSDSRAIRDDLARLIGAEALASEQQCAAYAIDGLVPSAVARPASIQDVAHAVEYANRANLKLAPWGRGARQALGDPLEQLDVVLSLERLAGVTEHDADNLTVSVRAGTTLAELQAAVRAAHQFVPLTPPMPEEATVGGVIATNANGPSQRAYGTCRDHVLGVRAVLASGEVVSSGGKTMKNVAGLDVTKLFIGSFGTLALIAEATFRTLPLPECSASVCARFDDSADLESCLSSILGSPLLPTSVDVATGACAAGDAGRLLFVSFDGSRSTVERQLRDAGELLRKHRAESVEELRGQADAAERTRLQDLPAQAAKDGACAVLRMHVPIAASFRAQNAAKTLARSLSFRQGTLSHAGNGVARLYLWTSSGLASASAKLSELIPSLRASAEKIGGWLFVEHAPLVVRKAIPCFGPMGDSAAVMKRLKEQFDPKGILNPGRMRLTSL